MRRPRQMRATYLYGLRTLGSHSISSSEQFVQGGPDFARLHLTLRIWQALHAPPRRFRGRCRPAGGVAATDMFERDIPRKICGLGVLGSASRLGDFNCQAESGSPALASAISRYLCRGCGPSNRRRFPHKSDASDWRMGRV